MRRFGAFATIWLLSVNVYGQCENGAASKCKCEGTSVPSSCSISDPAEVAGVDCGGLKKDWKTLGLIAGSEAIPAQWQWSACLSPVGISTCAFADCRVPVADRGAIVAGADMQFFTVAEVKAALAISGVKGLEKQVEPLASKKGKEAMAAVCGCAGSLTLNEEDAAKLYAAFVVVREKALGTAWDAGKPKGTATWSTVKSCQKTILIDLFMSHKIPTTGNSAHAQLWNLALEERWIEFSSRFSLLECPSCTTARQISGAQMLRRCMASCNPDVVFVLDSSSSVNDSAFEVATAVISSMAASFGTQNFDHTKGGVNAGMVMYANCFEVHKVIPMGTHKTLTAFQKAVGKIERLTGGTCTGDAMNMGFNMIRESRRPGVAQLEFVITDGNTSWPWKQIGVGSNGEFLYETLGHDDRWRNASIAISDGIIPLGVHVHTNKSDGTSLYNDIAANVSTSVTERIVSSSWEALPAKASAFAKVGCTVAPGVVTGGTISAPAKGWKYFAINVPECEDPTLKVRIDPASGASELSIGDSENLLPETALYYFENVDQTLEVTLPGRSEDGAFIRTYYFAMVSKDGKASAITFDSTSCCGGAADETCFKEIPPPVSGNCSWAESPMEQKWNVQGRGPCSRQQTFFLTDADTKRADEGRLQMISMTSAQGSMSDDSQSFTYTVQPKDKDGKPIGKPLTISKKVKKSGAIPFSTGDRVVPKGTKSIDVVMKPTGTDLRSGVDVWKPSIDFDWNDEPVAKDLPLGVTLPKLEEWGPGRGGNSDGLAHNDKRCAWEPKPEYFLVKDGPSCARERLYNLESKVAGKTKTGKIKMTASAAFKPEIDGQEADLVVQPINDDGSLNGEPIVVSRPIVRQADGWDHLQTPNITLPAGTAQVLTTIRVRGSDKKPIKVTDPALVLWEDLSQAPLLPVGTVKPDLPTWPVEKGNGNDGKPNSDPKCTWTPEGVSQWKVEHGPVCSREETYRLDPKVKHSPPRKFQLWAETTGKGASPNEELVLEVQPVRTDGSPVGKPVTVTVKANGAEQKIVTPKIDVPPDATHATATLRVKGADKGDGYTVVRPKLHLDEIFDSTAPLTYGSTDPAIDTMSPVHETGPDGKPMDESTCKWAPGDKTEWHASGGRRCSREKVFDLDDSVVEGIENPKVTVTAQGKVKVRGGAPGQTAAMELQPMNKQGHPTGLPIAVTAEAVEGSTDTLRTPVVELPEGTEIVRARLVADGADKASVMMSDPVIIVAKDLSGTAPLDYGEKKPTLDKWDTVEGACDWKKVASEQWSVTGGASCTRERIFNLADDPALKTKEGTVKMRAEVLTKGSKPGQKATLTVQPLDKEGNPIGSPITVEQPLDSSQKNTSTPIITLPPGTENVKALLKATGSDKGPVELSEPKIILWNDMSGAKKLPPGATPPNIDEWKPEPGKDLDGNPNSSPSCKWTNASTHWIVNGAPLCSREREFGFTKEILPKIPVGKIGMWSEVIATPTKPGQGVELEVQPLRADGSPSGAPVVIRKEDLPVGKPTLVKTPKVTLPPGTEFARVTVRARGTDAGDMKLSEPVIHVDEDLSDSEKLPFGTKKPEISKWPKELGTNDKEEPREDASCQWIKKATGKFLVTGGPSCSRERVFDLEDDPVSRIPTGNVFFQAEVDTKGTKPGQTVEIEALPLKADGSPAGPPVKVTQVIPQDSPKKILTDKVPLPQGTEYVRAIVRATGGEKGPIELTEPKIHLTEKVGDETLGIGEKKPNVTEWKNEPGKNDQGENHHDDSCSWKEKSGAEWLVTGGPSCSKTRVFDLDDYPVAQAKNGGTIKLEAAVFGSGTAPGQEVELVVVPLKADGTPSGPEYKVKKVAPVNGKEHLKSIQIPVQPGTENVRVTVRALGGEKGSGMELSDPAIRLWEEFPDADKLPFGTTEVDNDENKWRKEPLNGTDGKPNEDPGCKWKKQGGESFEVTGGPRCSRQRIHDLDDGPVSRIPAGVVNVRAEVDGKGSKPGQEVEIEVQPLNKMGKPIGQPIKQKATLPTDGTSEKLVTDSLKLPKGTEFVRTTVRPIGADKGPITVSDPKIHVSEDIKNPGTLGVGEKATDPSKWGLAPGTSPECKWRPKSTSKDNNEWRVFGATRCSRRKTFDLEDYPAARANLGKIKMTAEVDAKGTAPGQKVEFIVQPLDRDGTPSGAPISVFATAPTSGTFTNIKTPEFVVPVGTEYVRATMHVDGGLKGDGIDIRDPTLTVIDDLNGSPELPFGKTKPPVDTWPNEPGNGPDGKPKNDDSCKWAKNVAEWTVTGSPRCSKQQPFDLADDVVSAIPTGTVKANAKVIAKGSGPGQKVEVEVQPVDDKGAPVGPPFKVERPLPTDGTPVDIVVPEGTLPEGAEFLKTTIRTKNDNPKTPIKLSDPEIVITRDMDGAKKLPIGTTTPIIDEWQNETSADAECSWEGAGAQKWRVSKGTPCARQRTYGFNDAELAKIKRGKISMEVEVDGQASSAGQEVELVVTPMDENGAPTGSPLRKTLPLPQSGDRTNVRIDESLLPPGTTFVATNLRVKGGDKGDGVKLTEPKIHLREDFTDAVPLPFGTTKEPVDDKWTPEAGTDPTSGEKHEDVSCKWTPKGEKVELSGGPRCSRQRNFDLADDVTKKVPTGKVTLQGEIDVKGKVDGQTVTFILEPLGEDGKPVGKGPIIVTAPAPAAGSTLKTPSVKLPPGTEHVRATVRAGDASKKPIELSEPRLIVKEDLSDSKELPLGLTKPKVDEWEKEPGQNGDGNDNENASCKWQKAGGEKWHVTGGPSCSRQRDYALTAEEAARTELGTVVLVAEVDGEGTVGTQDIELEVTPLKPDGSPSGAPVLIKSGSLPVGSSDNFKTPEIRLPAGTTNVRTVIRGKGGEKGTGLFVSDPKLHLSLDHADSPKLPFGPTKPDVDTWSKEPGTDSTGKPREDAKCKWTPKNGGVHVEGAPQCSREKTFPLDDGVKQRMSNGKVELEAGVTATGTAPGQKVELVVQPVDKNGEPIGPPKVVAKDLTPAQPTRLTTGPIKLPEGTDAIRTTVRPLGSDKGTGIDVSEPLINVTEDMDPAEKLPLGTKEPKIPDTWTSEPGTDSEGTPRDNATACKWSKAGEKAWIVTGAPSCSRERLYELLPMEKLKANVEKLELTVEVDGKTSDASQTVEIVVVPLNKNGVPTTLPITVSATNLPDGGVIATRPIRLPKGTEFVRTTVRGLGNDEAQGVKLSEPKIRLRELLTDTVPLDFGTKKPEVAKWPKELGTDGNNKCKWTEDAAKDELKVNGAALCSRDRVFQLSNGVLQRVPSGKVEVVAEVDATGTKPDQKVELVVQPLKEDGSPAGPPQIVEAAAPTNGEQTITTPPVVLPPAATHAKVTMRAKGGDKGVITLSDPKIRVSEAFTGEKLPFGETKPVVDKWPDQDGNKTDGKPATDKSCKWTAADTASWKVTGGPTCSKDKVYGIADEPKSKIRDGKVSTEIEVTVSGTTDNGQAVELEVQPLDKDGKPIGSPIRVKEPVGKGKETVKAGPLQLPPGTERIRTTVRTDGGELGEGITVSDPKIKLTEDPKASTKLPIGKTTPDVDTWDKESGKEDATCKWEKQAGNTWRVSAGASCAREKRYQLEDEAVQRAMVGKIEAWFDLNTTGSDGKQEVELVLQPVDKDGKPLGPAQAVKRPAGNGKMMHTTTDKLKLPAGTKFIDVKTRVTGSNSKPEGVLLSDPLMHLSEVLDPTEKLPFGTKEPPVDKWTKDPTNGGDNKPNDDPKCKWTAVKDILQTWDVTGAKKCSRERIYDLDDDVVARIPEGEVEVEVETDVKGTAPGQMVAFVVQPLGPDGSKVGEPIVVSAPAPIGKTGKVASPTIKLPGGTENMRVTVRAVGGDKGTGVRVSEPRIHVQNDMGDSKPLPFGPTVCETDTWKPEPGSDKQTGELHDNKCEWTEQADGRWKAKGGPSCSREKNFELGDNVAPKTAKPGRVTVSIAIDPEGTAPGQEVDVVIQPFDESGRPLGEPVVTKLPAKDAVGDDGMLHTPEMSLPNGTQYVRVATRPKGADKGDGVYLTEPIITVKDNFYPEKLPVGTTKPDVGSWDTESGKDGAGNDREDVTCMWTPKVAVNGSAWLVTGGPSCSREKYYALDDGVDPSKRSMFIQADGSILGTHPGQKVELLIIPMDDNGKELSAPISTAKSAPVDNATVLFTPKSPLPGATSNVKIVMRVQGGELGTGVTITDPQIRLTEDLSGAGKLPIGPTDPQVTSEPWKPAAGGDKDGPLDDDKCKWAQSGVSWSVSGAKSCAREGLYEIDEDAKDSDEAKVEVEVKAKGTKVGQKVAVTVQPLDKEGKPLGPNITKWVDAPAGSGDEPATLRTPPIDLPPGTTHVRTTIQATGGDKGPVRVSEPVIVLTNKGDENEKLPIGTTTPQLPGWKDEGGKNDKGKPNSSPECSWERDVSEELGWKVSNAPSCSKVKIYDLDQRAVNRVATGKVKLTVDLDTEGSGPSQEVELEVQQIDEFGRPIGQPNLLRRSVTPGSRQTLTTGPIVLRDGATAVRTTIRALGADEGNGILLADPAIKLTEDMEPSKNLGFEKKEPKVDTWPNQPGKDADSKQPNTDPSCEWRSHGDREWDVVGGPSCSKEHLYKLKPEVVSRLEADQDSKIVVKVNADSKFPGQAVELEIHPMRADGSLVPGAMPIKVTKQLNPTGVTEIETFESQLPRGTEFVRTFVRVTGGDKDTVARLSDPVIEVFHGERPEPPAPTPKPTMPPVTVPVGSPIDLPLGTTDGKLKEWKKPTTAETEPLGLGSIDSNACKWTEAEGRHLVTGAPMCTRRQDFKLSASERSSADAGKLNFSMDIEVDGSSPNQQAAMVVYPLDENGKTTGDPVMISAPASTDGSKHLVSLPSSKVPPGTAVLKVLVIGGGGDKGSGVGLADPRLHLIGRPTLPEEPTPAPVDKWSEEQGSNTDSKPFSGRDCKWTPKGGSAPPSWTVTGGEICSKVSSPELSPEAQKKVQEGKAALEFSVTAKGSQPDQEVELEVQPVDEDGLPIGKPIKVSQQLDSTGKPTKIAIPDAKLPLGTAGVNVAMRPKGSDKGPIELTEPKLHLTDMKVVKPTTPTDPENGKPTPGKDEPSCKFVRRADGKLIVTGGGSCSRTSTHNLDPSDAAKTKDGRINLTALTDAIGSDASQEVELTLQPIDAQGKPIGPPISAKKLLKKPGQSTGVKTSSVVLPAGTEQVKTTVTVKGSDKGTGVVLDGPFVKKTEDVRGTELEPGVETPGNPGNWTSKPGGDEDGDFSDKMCTYTQNADGPNTTRVTGGNSCTKEHDYKVSADDIHKTFDGRLSFHVDGFAVGTADGQEVAIIVQPLFPNGTASGPQQVIKRQLVDGDETAITTAPLKLPPGTGVIRTTIRTFGSIKGDGVVYRHPTVTLREAPALQVGTTEGEVDKWVPEPGTDAGGQPHNDETCQFTKQADGSVIVAGGDSCSRQETHVLLPAEKKKAKQGKLKLEVEVPAVGTAPDQDIEVIIQPVKADGSPVGKPIKVPVTPLPPQGDRDKPTVLKISEFKLPPEAEAIKTTIRVSGGDKGDGVILESPKYHLREDVSGTPLPIGSTPGELEKDKPEAGTDDKGKPRNEKGCKFSKQTDGRILVTGGASCSRQHTFAILESDKPKLQARLLNATVSVTGTGSALGQEVEVIMQPLFKNGTAAGPPSVVVRPLSTTSDVSMITAPINLLPDAEFIRTTVRARGSDKGTGILLTQPDVQLTKITPISIGVTKPSFPTGWTNGKDPMVHEGTCKTEKLPGDAIKVTGGKMCSVERNFSLDPRAAAARDKGQLKAEIEVKVKGTDPKQEVQLVVQPRDKDGNPIGPAILVSEKVPPGGGEKPLKVTLEKVPEGTAILEVSLRPKNADKGDGVTLTEPIMTLTEKMTGDDVVKTGTKEPKDVEKWQPDPDTDDKGRPHDHTACKWTKRTSSADSWHVTGAPSCAKERDFKLEPYEVLAAKEGRLKVSAAATMIGTDPDQFGEMFITPLFRNGTPSGPPQLVRKPLKRGMRNTDLRSPEVVVPPGTEYLRVALRAKNPDQGSGVKLVVPSLTLRQDPIPAAPIEEGTRDLSLPSWTETPLDGQPRNPKCVWAEATAPRNGAPAFQVTGGHVCTATRTFSLKPTDVAATGNGELFATVESLTSGTAGGQRTALQVFALDENGAQLPVDMGGKSFNGAQDLLASGRALNLTTGSFQLPAGTKYLRAMLRTTGANTGTGIELAKPKLHLTRVQSVDRTLVIDAWTPAPGSDKNCKWTRPTSASEPWRVTGGGFCGRYQPIPLNAESQTAADVERLYASVKAQAQAGGSGQLFKLTITPTDEDGIVLSEAWSDVITPLPIDKRADAKTPMRLLPAGTRILMVRHNVNNSGTTGASVWDATLTVEERVEGPLLSPPGERDLPLPSWTNRPGYNPSGTPYNDESCRWSPISGGWVVSGGRSCSKLQTYTLADARGKQTVEFEVDGAGTGKPNEEVTLLIVPLTKTGVALTPIATRTVPLPADGSTARISTGPLELPPNARFVRAYLVAKKPVKDGEIELINANLKLGEEVGPEDTLPRGGPNDLDIPSWRAEPGHDAGCVWTPNGDREWIVTRGASCGRERIFGLDQDTRNKAAEGRINVTVTSEGHGTGNGERLMLMAIPLRADGSVAGNAQMYIHDRSLPHDASWVLVSSGSTRLPRDTEYIRMAIRIIDANKGSGVGVRLPQVSIMEIPMVQRGTLDADLGAWTNESPSPAACNWAPQGARAWLVRGARYCARDRVFPVKQSDLPLPFTFSATGRGSNGGFVELLVQPITENGAPAGPAVTQRAPITGSGADTVIRSGPMTLPVGTRFVRTSLRVIDGNSGVLVSTASLFMGEAASTPTPTSPPVTSTPTSPPTVPNPNPTNPPDGPGGAARGFDAEDPDKTRVMRGLISGLCVSFVVAVIVGLLSRKAIA